MDYDFGDLPVGNQPSQQQPQQEDLYLSQQEERIAKMVKDKKWVPILNAMESKIDFYKSMSWVDPKMNNEEIGQNAKVGAIVIGELEGLLNEIRAVAGYELGTSGPDGDRKATTKAVRQKS